MDDFAEIQSLLAAANQALLNQRPADARPSLGAALPLLAARVASNTSFSAIVTIQAGWMSLLAGDPKIAREYMLLLVDEVGRQLELLATVFAGQVKKGDRDAARSTIVVAYTYAVAFVPFVKGARMANLLAGDPAHSNSPEVAMIGRILTQIRPKLDELQWESWGYPSDSEHRARHGAAWAVVRWAHALMDNRDSGEDVRWAQELAMVVEQLSVGFTEDQLAADYWNLAGRIFFAYGESHYDAGLQAAERAARICEQIGNYEDAARDYSNMAAIEIERAAFLESNGKQADADQMRSRAENHLTAARSALHDPEAFIDASTNLVALLARQERWAEAESVFNQAWEKLPLTGDQRVYLAPRIAGNFASSLFEAGRAQDAEQWLRVAVKDVEAVRTRDPEIFQVVMGTLGRLLASSGRAEEGYGYLKQAKEHLESYRTSFIAERSNSELLKRYRWVYEAMIDCCVTLGQTQAERWEEAYELAELIKWRTLTVLLRYLPLGLLDERSEPRVKEEAELLRRAMVALSQPAASALTGPEIFEALEKLWSEMEAAHPQYIAFRRQRTTTLAETKELLDEKVPCLVEYFLGDQYATAVAFVVNRNRQTLEAVRLPTTLDAVARQVSELRAVDDRQPEKQFREISLKLYNALIAPVLVHLPAAAGICVVPHRALHNLPFAALFDGTRFLIERNPLVVAPTASALRWWVEKNSGRKDSCLIFTATSRVYSGDERQVDLALFEDLARKRLKPLFAQSKILAGPGATKANLLAEFRKTDDWAIFHIACHGEFGKEGDGNEGLNARLIMAGEPHPDKDLSAVEIFNSVRTRASLVTLSACESAISESSTNDELAGLAHAFLLAGAASVLATLSYVRQPLGVAITERFYRKWMAAPGGDAVSKDAVSKIEALQIAQIEALRRREWMGWGSPVWHPQQWSAFALYGDWR